MAFKDDREGSHSGSFTLSEAKPDFLKDYIHALDVSHRKVIMTINVSKVTFACRFASVR